VQTEQRPGPMELPGPVVPVRFLSVVQTTRQTGRRTDRSPRRQ
jgi:hypothetical protein